MTYDTTATIPIHISRRSRFDGSNFWGARYSRWLHPTPTSGLCEGDEQVLQAAVAYANNEGIRHDATVYLIISYGRAFAWQISEWTETEQMGARRRTRQPFYFAETRYDLNSRSQAAQRRHKRLVELGYLMQQHPVPTATLTNVA
jgi:hypothetical protein